MEENTQATSQEVPVNSHVSKTKELKKEDDEETTLEGEFIKVEKESIDVKENSVTVTSNAELEEVSCSPEMNSRIKESDSELTEAHHKIKELESKLETLSQELQHAEFEKARMQTEASIANEKLDQSNLHCKELDVDLRRLKEEMVEVGLKHQTQLESLQQAFTDQELKNKELLNVKEAFDAISFELESSRKKAEKLELDLLSSADELRKFEELSNERGLYADSESKKALELEKMLEVAKLNVKEMENQMGLMQEELKSLYDKVTQSQHAEEVLSKTRSDLSVALKELELSKLKVSELQEKVVSQDAVLHDLAQELNLHKSSEEQVREGAKSLEITLLACKEDIQRKDVHINELELKLQKSLEEKGKLETDFQIQDLRVSSLQEEILTSSKEKEALEMTIGELNGELMHSKERCGELEKRLNSSEENFTQKDILLSEALSLNTQLQQSLAEQQKESSAVAEMLSQRNIEFEDMLKMSNAALDDVKAELKESLSRLISLEEENSKLEQQVNLAELKCGDSDREIKELHDKVSELSNLLKTSEEEHEISKCHFQAYHDRVSQLESSLEKLSLRKAELEEELKDLEEKCTEHESHSTAARNRSLELEELIQVSHSKVENSGKRVSELELLLEITNHRVLELEEQLNTMELRHSSTEAELEQKSSKLSELSEEMEAFRLKSSSLELALDAASNKEKELTDLFNVVTEEKKNFEDLSTDSAKRLMEAENLVDALQAELNSTKEKLQNVVSDFEASGIREKDLREQLKFAQEQLEHHGRAVENATARSLELESLHDSLSKESELKLQEAMLSLSQKNSEVEQLHGKLNSFEEQVSMYQNQAAESTNRLAFLETELKTSGNRLVSLANIIDELNSKLLDAEKRSEEFSSENQFLAETNIKLKTELETHQHKINELHDSLSSVHAEKDASAEKLSFHVQTIAELRDQHSKALELHSESVIYSKETEAKLAEACERLTQKESEARELNERINDLERLVKSYEEQLHEAAAATKIQTIELDESLSKFKILDGIVEEARSKISQLESQNECLAEANMKLTQNLAENETQINGLQATLSTILLEKENACGELQLMRRTNEELVQKITSDCEALQSQVSALVDEKNLLDEKHLVSRNEMQTMIAQMEEEIKNYQAKECSLNELIGSLELELNSKSEMQEQIAELSKKLLSSESQFTEEMEKMKLACDEKEVALLSKVQETTTVLKEKDVLCERLEQLQKELHFAQTTVSEQAEVHSTKNLEHEAAIKQVLTEMEAKHQYALALEKQIEDMKQELHQFQMQSTKKVKEENEWLKTELAELKVKLNQSAEEVKELESKLQLTYKYEQYKGDNFESKAKDGVQTQLRSLDFSTLKNQVSPTTAETVVAKSDSEATTTAEPTGLMALKFILGVALVSMIVGVILGKRY